MATSTSKTTTTSETSSGGFSADERAAMKERAAELRAEGKKGSKKADGLQAVLDQIAKMAPDDRELAERVHVTITTSAPELSPKTWYGMPAYANADDKVVVFFQDSGKFKYRYSTLGFQDAANLDDGDMWPASFALVSWSPAVEKKVKALVKAAISWRVCFHPNGAEPRGSDLTTAPRPRDDVAMASDYTDMVIDTLVRSGAVTLHPPASAVDFLACEGQLGHQLPDDLRSVLQQTDGLDGPDGINLMWPTLRIGTDNRHFRRDADFAQLYMPFDGMLFFGDLGDGDQLAVALRGSGGVFLWDHELDSRTWVASSVTRFLEKYLEEASAL